MLYAHHSAAARAALGLLALDLIQHDRVAHSAAVDALTTGPAGHTGEDWLGHQPSPHLTSLVYYAFAELAERGIVRDLDSEHWEQDPPRRPGEAGWRRELKKGVGGAPRRSGQ